ncbi:MAG TPA: TCP-1/cpn60 chaperonin family protein, partial [Patescibacteria group bacterium]|nr:TCP-1/cpn60 chaperonin family protein [Patescibacteria group bacterium]
VISEDIGRKLESVTVEDLGKAKKVVSDKDNSLIVAESERSAVQARIQQVKKEIERTTSEFDKEKLEERLAKLAGGVAVIKVGAATELEMKDKQERVKDAVAATKAAVEEGIVPGGGVTLLRAREVLVRNNELGEKVGRRILYTALDSPLRGILSNSTANWQEILLKVKNGDGEPSPKKNQLENYGYDVMKNRFGDMFEFGIVDPTKVVRTALQNAVSVATMMLTTEALVTDIPEKEEKTPVPGAGMGGGMEY